MNALKRILLVDDSPRDTELALGALAERTDGQPVVVLLDLKRPKVDGLEVLRQMKSDPQLKVIPVVVMTSSREEQDLLNSYQLGVNADVATLRSCSLSRPTLNPHPLCNQAQPNQRPPPTFCSSRMTLTMPN